MPTLAESQASQSPPDRDSVSSIVSRSTEVGSYNSSPDQYTTSAEQDMAADTTKSRNVGSFNANEKRQVGLRALEGKAKRSRSWRTTIVRFGPLSGIVGMLLALASLVASLGILAGSDNQPVPSWSSPPSTYLAIFTALGNLSLRYAAIQGVVIAWWYRALKGSTLAKLHWDWRAGTTLRGAITSGRHMGILGLACVFSTVVVIDGPLLQRSSTVVPSPITNRPVLLDVFMAPQIPHGFFGDWGVWSGLTNKAFNDTVPTNDGRASNHVVGYPNYRISREVTRSWYSDAPLGGVVQGCPDSSSCIVKIHAPALFPTCSNHSTPLNAYQRWDWAAGQASEIAAPLGSLSFSIGTNLLLSGGRETLNLFTAAATSHGCKGRLDYSICTLESGIGEYTVEVKNNEIQMRDLSTPNFVAISNNTAVNTSEHVHTGLHSSTLGGIQYMAFEKWDSILQWHPTKNIPVAVYFGAVPWTLIVKPNTGNEICASYFDPTEMVLTSLNKLVVYIGAHAANLQVQPELMDPGISLNTTASGHVIGLENEFKTNYWFFLAAAIVEITCIALIAPTYWGWWKLGRPVSFSPLEVAKAFEAPMLADYNSNASGRDLAKAVDDFYVQYGVTSNNPASQGTKLAFAKPATVTAPRNGSHFEV